jgi:membrane protein implicated in regulation of membrane protease activity
MPAWLIWFVLAAMLGTVEIVTLAFAAGLMATAAVAAGLVAAVGGGLEAQAVAFAVTSLASLAVAMPLARRRAAQAGYRSGAQGLLDRSAVVLTQVDAESGTVRIGGEVWSARAYDETQVLPQGTRVSVFEIVGATALVYPREFS